MRSGLKIILTFKESERYLWEEIKKHSGYSAWIKDLLKEQIKSPSNEGQVNGK